LCTSIRPFAQRRADVVGEFQRRRAGAAFAAVDHDEVGRDAGLQHGLDDGEPFPGMADGEFEADRLAAGQFAQAGDEFKQFDRRVENAGGAGARCSRCRPVRRAPRRFPASHLGAGQDAAVARLGALRELDLDHLDLVECRRFRRSVRRRTCHLASRQPK
jgi:hypothetical protein